MLRYALLSFLLVPLGAQVVTPEQDPLAAIEVLAASTTTPEQRGEAFAIVRAAKFARFAQKLVRTLSACRLRRGADWVESGIGPRTDQPWLEEKLRLEDRISFTLLRLWNEHTRTGVAIGDAALLVDILEDREGGDMRCLAVQQFAMQLGDYRREDPALVRDLMLRLDKLARTDASNTIRASLVSVLVVNGEAGPFVDVAIEIAGTEKQLVQRGELLRRTGILEAMQRMSPAVKRRCLQYAFLLLRGIDDGKGTGCGLAMDIGRGLGIDPAYPAGGPFTPDPRSRVYQGKEQLLPGYFQHTVVNALAWYDKHKDD